MGARQPGFGFNRRNVARGQLQPQFQNLLPRHAFHVSSGLILGLGIVVLASTAELSFMRKINCPPSGAKTGLFFFG